MQPPPQRQRLVGRVPTVPAVVLALLVGLLTPLQAVASTPAPVVTDVPVLPRAAPTRVAVLASSEAGVLLMRDYPTRGDGGSPQIVWLPAGGEPYERRYPVRAPFALVGSLMVNGSSRTSLYTTDLARHSSGSDGFVEGTEWVSVGADNVLRDVDADGTDGARLMVWTDQEGERPVSGLTGRVETLEGSFVHEDVVVVASSDPATGVRSYFAVDTSSRTAAPLRTEHEVEDGTVVEAGDLLVWWSRDRMGTEDEGDDRLLVSRTTLRDGVPGEVVHSDPFVGATSGPLPRLVVADGEVLLSVPVEPVGTRADLDAPVGPLHRLLDDGRLVQVGDSRPVFAAPGGGLVTSDGVAVLALPATTVDPAEDVTPLWTPPVWKLPASAVALDGARLLVAGADVRWWDEDALTEAAPAPSGVLVDEVALELSANRGGALVRLPYGLGSIAAAAPGGDPPGGTAGRLFDGFESYYGQLGTLSGDHLLTAENGAFARPQLWDLSHGGVIELARASALHDGVLWQTAQDAFVEPGLDGRAVLPDVLVGRHLDSGATRVVTTSPGCRTVERTWGSRPLQAAGRWLLAQCQSGSWQLLDLLGERPPEELGSLREPRLGNGFLVRRGPGDAQATLQWRALGTGDPQWRDLGPVSGGGPATEVATRHVAVSTWGDSASVAWITPEGGVRHASLPGAPVDPGPPDGPSQPPVPVSGLASTYPDDGDVTMTWDHPGGDQLLGFLVVVREVRGREDVFLVPPTERAAALDVHYGERHTVRVEAVGPAGRSGAVTVEAEPRLVRPGAPSFSIDPWGRGDRTTPVEWHQPTGARPVPTEYELYVDGRLVAVLPYRSTKIGGGTQGRSRHEAVFDTPVAGEYRVEVVARLGDWAESYGAQTKTVQGPDLVPPHVTSTSLPKVATGSSVRYEFDASDDRADRGFQVRVRQALVRKPLGPWSNPAAWSTLHPAVGGVTVGLAEGETRCLQVRARDGAGNWSSWSAQRCVTRAVDDRHLAATGAHTRLRSSAAMMGTVTRVETRASQVRLTGARTDAVWLVATRCPTCGVVEVVDDGVVLAEVDLRAPTTRVKQVIGIPVGRAARSGTFAVRSATGRPVHVDGLALRSY